VLDYSLGIKQLGGESDHSSPTIAEVNNERSYTSTPSYSFLAFTGTTLIFAAKFSGM
jgi:hypothetical protein